jgi:hypothetical protein
MRGADLVQDTLYRMTNLESFVPGDPPRRPVREILNTALKRMNPPFEASSSPINAATSASGSETS